MCIGAQRRHASGRLGLVTALAGLLKLRPTDPACRRDYSAVAASQHIVLSSGSSSQHRVLSSSRSCQHRSGPELLYEACQPTVSCVAPSSRRDLVTQQRELHASISQLMLQAYLHSCFVTHTVLDVMLFICADLHRQRQMT